MASPCKAAQYESAWTARPVTVEASFATVSRCAGKATNPIGEQ
jgi:hypothetical protein